MKSRREKVIEAALNADQPDQQDIDKSLRAQAFRRAGSQKPPKTLTAWEWEDWYKLHGMPENFKEPKSSSKFSLCFWKRKSTKSPANTVSQNCMRSADEDAEF